MDLSTPVVVQHHSYLPIFPMWACPWAKNLSNQAALGPDLAKPISLKLLDGFIPNSSCSSGCSVRHHNMADRSMLSEKLDGLFMSIVYCLIHKNMGDEVGVKEAY